MLRKPNLILFFALLQFACDVGNQGDYNEKLVVFGHLISHSIMLDTIQVSLSYSIDAEYTQSADGVTDAKVTLWDGISAPLCLTSVAGHPGKYLDQTWKPHRILPSRPYQLTVRWRDHFVEANTFVPDTVAIQSIISSKWFCSEQSQTVDPIDLHIEENSSTEIENALETVLFHRLKMDTVVYFNGECYTSDFASIPLFVISWDTDTTNGSQIALITTLAMDADISNAIVDTSFTANALKGPMDIDENGNLFRPPEYQWNSTSGLIPFNWLFFNYYGPQLVTIEFADASMHDYLAGSAADYNPYLPPRGNIDGGYGLFYSSYIRQFVVFVAPDIGNNQNSPEGEITTVK